jgi:tetratricopeptide (TPR) repeat protein
MRQMRANTCRSQLASGTLTDDQTEAALNGLANVYVETGDFPNAIKILTVMIERNPKDFRPYLSRGVAYSGLGQHDLALADFSQAIAIQPKRCYDWRARAYFAMHQYDRAVADCDAELQLVPDDSAAKTLRDRAQSLMNSSSSPKSEPTASNSAQPDTPAAKTAPGP